jgi:hypothetical protein
MTIFREGVRPTRTSGQLTIAVGVVIIILFVFLLSDRDFIVHLFTLYPLVAPILIELLVLAIGVILRRGRNA